MSEALVSVVIPTYNNAKTIGATLASVARQTHQNLEIIVVNDGSTDGNQTAEILTHWQAIEPRLRVLSQENKGVSAARNRGIREAKGRFIVFLDGDDELLPESVAKRAAALEAAGPGKWLCLTGSILRNLDGRLETPAYPNDVTLERFFDCGLIRPSGWMVARSTAEHVGGFREDLHYSEDGDWALRLLQSADSHEKGGFLIVNPPTLIYSRPKPGKLYAKMSESMQLALEAHLPWLQQNLSPAYFAKLVEKTETILENARNMEERAGRSISPPLRTRAMAAAVIAASKAKPESTTPKL